MLKETVLLRVECPECRQKLMDKAEDASGKVQPKCSRCRNVWEVDLGTNEFKLISKKTYTETKRSLKSYLKGRIDH
ncbi:MULTISPECIES: hypothetical protein [Bacillaceae]|uniref:Mu-like prophage protein Com n=1 Tax=Evansella alkalicola TaxID=745819 RepID=A0ABS6JWW6_9BACI|nr:MULTISPECIES: hypothetical protein [Bacillaceae]MBU9723092.1 hypothetical protein [Bacillus alkalicola]